MNQLFGRQRSPDKMLIGTILILVVCGTIVLASASIVLSQKNYGENYYYLKHQLIGIGAGLAAFFLAAKVHYRFWKIAAPFVLLASIVLMILVFVPGMGVNYQGATRWVSILGFSFQPSEVLKIAFIMYLARWLEAKRNEIEQDATSVVSILLLLGIPGVLLILQPDFGTLLVIMSVSFTMYFASRAKFSHIALAALVLFLGLLVLGIMEPYRIERIRTYLAPNTEILGKGYQINQSLIAIGSGGFMGQGIGRSVQKYNFLPEPTGDSIFAILAEELGFMGVLVILALFFLLLKKGFGIAERARDDFGKFLALGFSSLIITQAFTNIMSISGIIPLTGIPLPFFSYGGSALVAILTASGILVNLSRHSVR